MIVRRFGVLVALLSALPSLACSTVQQGIEVTVELDPIAAPSATNSDAGQPIVIARGVLALGSVELLPCVDETTQALTADQNPGILHVEGSPTLLGTPAARSLASPASLTLGVLRPPPGEYCKIRQLYFTADSDALGIEPDQVGDSMQLEGELAGTPFRLRADATLQVITELDPPLRLDTEGTNTATVALTSTPGAWFAGLSFDADRERDDALALLVNLQALLGATIR